MTERESTPGTTEKRYRWFKISLVSGGLLAVLLLVNSVLNYTFVSRRIVVEQLRRELSKQVVAFEHELRARADQKADLQTAVEEFRKDREKTLWVEIRDREHKVLAHSGAVAAESFTAGEIRAAMRNREPLFKTRNTPSGEVLVEIFPVRLPRSGEQRNLGGTVEMAISTDSANAVFWPVRRNLIINCSAAVALLVALVLIAFRFKQYVQGKQLEQQVEIARKVQQALMPSPTTAPRAVQMAAECVPALGVTGDFHDAFEAGPGRVGLVMGDVSGKGIPAALLMGVIHGAVRSSCWAQTAAGHEEASSRINGLLCERASGERYASMFWAYYDAHAASLHYVNAGHCAPLLVRRAGERVRVTELTEGGPVMGLLPGARYEQASTTVEAGDLLVMFSDGLVEALNQSGEEFGDERLRAAVMSAAADATPAQVQARILEAVEGFAGNVRRHDDLTLVVVQFDPAPPVTADELAMENLETL